MSFETKRLKKRFLINIMNNIFRNKYKNYKFMSIKNFIVLIFVLSINLVVNNYTNIVYSQKIKIVRTDVDLSRDTIVTASYNFKFDIYLDSIQNCNTAALEFRYNNSDNVKLSSYKIGDFGENGKILIIPSIDPIGATESTLKLRILSGQPIGENEFDNPKIITLEFTVLQNAVHNSKLNIEFVQALVTSFKDSIAQEISLPLIKQTYTIHSFVNIYPGDANNDGIVNLSDWTKIDLFTALDPVSDKFRRFKRKNPSTMWSPQLVLAWDNELATYADCDGDGSITVSDAIVVVQNDSKTRTIINRDSHNAGIINNSDNQIDDSDINKQVSNVLKSTKTNFLNSTNDDEIKIPIKVNSNRKFKALQLQFDFKNLYDINNYKFDKNINNSIISDISIIDVNFQKNGAFFDFESDYIIDKRNLKLNNSNIIELAIASFDPEFTSQNSEIIGFIIVKLNQKNLELKSNVNLDLINEIYGIDSFGNKFDLINENQNLTSVNDFEENNNEISLVQNSNNLEIKVNQSFSLNNIELFNITGETINLKNISQNLYNSNEKSIILDLEKYGISKGLYILKIEYTDFNKKFFNKIMKIYR